MVEIADLEPFSKEETCAIADISVDFPHLPPLPFDYPRPIRLFQLGHVYTCEPMESSTYISRPRRWSSPTSEYSRSSFSKGFNLLSCFSNQWYISNIFVFGCKCQQWTLGVEDWSGDICVGKMKWLKNAPRKDNNFFWPESSHSQDLASSFHWLCSFGKVLFYENLPNISLP